MVRNSRKIPGKNKIEKGKRRLNEYDGKMGRIIKMKREEKKMEQEQGDGNRERKGEGVRGG